MFSFGLSSFARAAPALRVALVLGVLGLVSALILWPLTGAHWLVGHYEGMRYLALAEHFRRALLATAGYPRWLPDLYGGRGYPTFVFYQPFIFFLDTLWRGAFHGSRALWWTLWSLLVTGGLGAYLLGRRSGGIRWGLLVAGVFLLSPYLYVDLFVRQALSELNSLMLLPWAFLALLWVRDRTQNAERTFGPVCLLSVSVAALIYAHPITSALFCIFAAPMVLALCWRGRSFDLQVAARVVLGFGLAILLSAPYWLPFTLMKGEVNLNAAFDGDFATHHTVYWSQFFRRDWGFGGSTADSPDDGMPLQLGAPHFALALIAAILSRRRPVAIASFGAYIAALVAMTPWCTELWRLPVFQQVQFPWRTLAMTTALQTLLLAGAGETFSRLRRPVQVLAALALLAALLVWHKDQFQTGSRIEDADAALREEVAGARWQILRYNGVDEFRPKTTPAGDPKALGDAPILNAADGTLSFEPQSNRYHIVATLRASKNTWLDLRQLYFPGWQVTVNGRRVTDEELLRHLRRDGTMRLPVAVPNEGQSTVFQIEARYAGPRGGGAAAGLAALALLTLAGLAMCERRRIASTKRDQLACRGTACVRR